MWVTKLLIFPVEIRIFCPKTTKIGIFGQFEPGHAGLFNALLWVGWWLGARAVSRKTPIYFIYLSKFCKSYNAVVNACFSTHLTGLCKEFDVEAGFFAVLGYIWKVLVLCQQLCTFWNIDHFKVQLVVLLYQEL